MTPRPLATLVLALLALLLAWSPDPARRRRCASTASARAPARPRPTAAASRSRSPSPDVAPAGETITLATTRGAFGAAAGPTRIVLPVTPGDDGSAVATAVLVGNGSAGGPRSPPPR